MKKTILRPAFRPLAASIAVLLGAAALLPTPAARAQTFDYIGNGNGGYWGDPFNWSTGTVPDSPTAIVNVSDGDAVAGDVSFTSPGGTIQPTVGTLNLRTSGGSGGGVSFADGTLALAAGGAINAGGNAGGRHGSGRDVTIRLDGPATLNTDASITFSTADSGSRGFSGAGSLVKAGEGIYVANGSSTYTGGTTLQAGTTIISGEAAFGTGALRIEGGSLDYRGETTVNNALTVAGSFGVTSGAVNPGASGTLLFSAPATLEAGTQTLTILSTPANPATVALTASVSGPGGLALAGGGTLRLAGANTYAGGTTLRAGTLQVENDAALSAGALRVEGGTLAYSGPGTRRLANAIALAGDVTLSRAGGGRELRLEGTITLEGAGQREVRLNADAGGEILVIFEGVVQGTGGLRVTNGAGINALYLGGLSANTYSGATSVAPGAQLFGSKQNGGAIPGDLSLEEGAFVGLQFADNQVGGTVRAAAGSTLGLFSSQRLDAVEINGTVAVLGSDATVLTVASGSIGTGPGVRGILTDNAGGAGDGTLRKVGPGVLRVGTSSDFDGGTRLEGGTLTIIADAALGAPGAPLVAAGAGGATVTLGSFGPLVVSTRPVTLDSSLEVAPSIGGISLGGVITGAGGLVKTSVGTLVLGNAGNTFAGGVSVRSGGLEFGSDGALGAASGELRVTAGALLRLTGDWATRRTVTLVDSTLDGPIVNGVTQSLGPIRLFTGEFDATLGGTVAGESSERGLPTLEKTGTGTLRFQGAGQKSGFNLDVVQGRVLVAGGAIIASNVTVRASGTLGGDGQIGDLIGEELLAGGDVINGGLVSPGDPQGDVGVGGPADVPQLLAALPDPTGTLRVRGNYTQTAAGTLQIEIAGRAPGDWDVLEVGGVAALGGTVRFLSLGGFRPRSGDEFVFLTADGGVDGRFSTVQTDAALVGGRVEYRADTARLIFQRRRIVPIFNEPEDRAVASPDAPRLPRLTPNQRSVARQLDRGIDSSSLEPLFAELDRYSLPGVPAALDRIAPEEYSVLYEIGIQTASVQAFNLDRHVGDLRAGLRGFSGQHFRLPGIAEGAEGKDAKDIMAPAPENRWSVFLSGSGEQVDLDSDFNARGYHFNTGGFTLGADCRVAENFAVGLFTGYAGTEAELAGGGHVEVNSAKLGLYAAGWGERWAAHAMVAGGWNDYDLKREGLGSSVRGDTDGGEITAAVSGFYNVVQTPGFYAGPVLEGQTTTVAYDGFDERGSAAPLRIEGNHSSALRTRVGARIGGALQRGAWTVRPELRALWQHEYGDRSRPTDGELPGGAGGAFRVEGPRTGRDALIVNASVSVLKGDRFATFLAYDGLIGQERLSAHTVSVGVRISF